jgi:hypothetical protein
MIAHVRRNTPVAPLEQQRRNRLTAVAQVQQIAATEHIAT